jgi:serine protease Do
MKNKMVCRVLAGILISIGVVTAVAAANRTTLMDTRVTFAQAVRKAEPAVVNIYAAKVVPGKAPIQGLGALPPVDLDGAVREKVQRSLGSGVIVDSSGVVVTNLHVIEGAQAVKVVLSDGREFAARQAGQDDKLDLAVLRLQLPGGEKVPAAVFGDSETLQMGDVVLALGNPFGMGQSVSFGVVSAVERSAAALSPYARFIQTDAPINPGNSGGALIDSTGKVVGINSGIFSKNGQSNGIGFAIPASLVQKVVHDIVTTGQVVRPWFGAEGQAMTSDVARQLGLKSAKGVLLTGVIDGSPADRAGLRQGDVILMLAGQAVEDPSALNEQILATSNLLGQSTTVTYWRSGKLQTANVVLTALPPRATNQQLLVKGYNPMTGYLLEPLTPALNVELGLPMGSKGVAVVNAPGRAPLAAYDLNFEVGDVLTSINGNTVVTPPEVQSALDSSRKGWEFRFKRNGRMMRVVTQ